MPKYLSGRVKRTDQAYLSTDRYQFLGLEQAEPNLADPPPGGTSSGIPVGQRSQIISVQGFPGERFWVPVEGGIIPGAVSVFEEGTLVGGLSSTTQLNFKGNIITAIGNRTGLSNPGVAVTLSLDPPGTDGQLLFNKNGEFGGSTLFNYDDSTVGVASVGIGTSAPTQNLHILGNIRLENKFFDTNNVDGATGQVLVRNSSGGLEYTNVTTLAVSAGGTFNNIQFHDDSGLLDGASNFVFVESTGRVGVGSTQPTVLFDVLGDSKFTGVTTFSDLRVSGILSASLDNGGVDFETDVRFEGANYNIEWDISESSLEFEDNAKAKFGSDLSKELEIFFDGTHSKIDHTSATGSLFLAGDSLILSNSGMSQYYLQAAENGSVLLNHSGITKFQTAETGAIVTGIFTATEEIQSDKITTIDNNFVNIDVSGIATMGTLDANFIDAENIDVGFATVTDKLNVSGFTTTKNIFVAGVGTFIGQLEVDSVKIDGSKVESTNGNLILESVTNTITVNDVIFVDNSDDSTSKDTGSIITQGGVGIEKGLAVGKNLTVGGATTLASSGGITTTGGDLFVGNNLFVEEDIVLRNITAGSANVTGLSTFVGLATFNGGISVESGLSTFRGDVFVAVGATVGLGDSVFLPDQKKIIFGNDDDFQISHTTSLVNQTTGDGKNVTNNTASLIEDTGPGPMIFKSDGGGGPGAFQFFDADWRPLIRMYSGATTETRPYQVALYYNSQRRLEITNEGVKVTGITSMTGNLKVGQYVESNLTPSDNQNFDLGQGGKSWNKLYIKEIIGTEKIAVEETTIDRLDVTGIATIATLGVTGLTTTKNLLVTENSVVSGLSTFVNNSNFQSSVGIGTTNIGSYKLYVQSPIATIARFERTTDQGGGSWAKVDIKAGTSSGNSYLTFSDVDNTEIGAINYEHNNDSLIFHVNNEDRLLITNNGVLEIERGSSTDQAIDIKTTATTGACRIRFMESGSSVGELAYSHNNNQVELIGRTGKSAVIFTNNTEKLRINTDGDLLPGGTQQDIGSNGSKWSGIYAENFYGDLIDVQKQFTTASLDVTGLSTFRGAVDIDASVDIRDNLVVSGNVDLGNQSSDSITVTARFDSSLIPINDDSIDLGLSNRQWKDLYIDGTANIDILDVDEGANIQGGAVINTLTVEDLAENEVVFITKNSENNDGKLEGSSKLTYNGTELFVDGNLRVTGDLSYDDVTNVDAIGIVTARKGFRATSGGIIVESGISTFKDKIEAQNVIQPKFGNNDSVGIQWESNPGGGGGDKAFLRYYVQNGENTRLEIGIENDADDDLYLKSSLVSTSGDLTVTSDLQVFGNTDIGNASGDTLTINARVDSNIIPSGTRNIGNANNTWSEVYADKFIGAVTGLADSAKQITVTNRNTNADHYVTFIATTPDGTVTDLFADLALKYNPNSNEIILPRIKPESIVDATNATGDNGYVPVADGTGNWQWGLNSDTKYDFTCVQSSPGVNNNPRLRLNTAGDDDDVIIEGGSNVTVTRVNDGQLRIDGAAGGGLTIDTNILDVFNLTSGNLKAVDANADRIVFWDNNVGELTYLAVGNGLTINGTSLSADSSAITVQDEGVSLPNDAEILNFTGNGVVASGTGATKTIDVPGLTVQDEGSTLTTPASRLNFTGNAVVASGTGATKTITITQGTGDGHVDLTNSNVNGFRNITFATGSNSEDLLINDNARCQVRPSDGAARFTGDITAFRSSDIRLKDNISPIKNALAKVSLISGNTFTWNEKSTDDKQGNDDVGVIAQEITTLGLPGITTTRDDGTQAVMYEKLVPLLIEAIKELKGEIDELKSTK